MILPSPDAPAPGKGPSAVLRDVVRACSSIQGVDRVRLRALCCGIHYTGPEHRLPAGLVAVLVIVSPRDARALGAGVPDEPDEPDEPRGCSCGECGASS